ncbi:MAG: hypothetical protein ACLVK0_13770 [Parabacteroides merdae]
MVATSDTEKTYSGGLWSMDEAQLKRVLIATEAIERLDRAMTNMPL